MNKIIANLQILNRENLSQEIIFFKSESFDQDEITKISSQKREIKNEQLFNLHISSFCTNYSDFDPFTGDTLSNLVK